MKRQRGFTLIEVLVALGIVSIALVAGLQATQALTNNAQRQSDMLLAQACAENEMARLRLTAGLPPTGTTDVECQQAGVALLVRLTVAATPNPSFRRVDALVLAENVPMLKLSTVLGRY